MRLSSPLLPSNMYGRLSVGQSRISICLYTAPGESGRRVRNILFISPFISSSWMNLRKKRRGGSPSENIISGSRRFALDRAIRTLPMILSAATFLDLFSSLSRVTNDLLSGLIDESKEWGKRTDAKPQHRYRMIPPHLVGKNPWSQTLLYISGIVP